jgi:hypothetical protein
MVNRGWQRLYQGCKGIPCDRIRDITIASEHRPEIGKRQKLKNIGGRGGMLA